MTKTDASLWKHFTDGGYSRHGASKKQCKYCSYSRTTHATECRKHLGQCASAPNDVRKKFAPACRRQLAFEQEDLPRRQPCEEPSAVVEEVTISDSTESRNGEAKLERFVNVVSVARQKKLRRLWTLAVITGRLSFNYMQNPHLKAFFEELGSGFVLPDRKQIAGPLLNDLSAEVQLKKENFYRDSKAITLVPDSWTNVVSNGVTNVMATSSCGSVLVLSEVANGERQTAQYYAEIVKRAVEIVGVDKVVGLISDNASNMMAMQELIMKEYPRIIGVRCFAHTLNLLLKGMCKLPFVKEVLSRCKMVLLELRHSTVKAGLWHREWEMYIKLMKEKTIHISEVGLSLPGATRWLAFEQLISKMKRAKQVLRNLETKDVFDVANNAETIRSTDFWRSVDIVGKILQPVCDALKLVQADCSTIADVPLHAGRIISALENIELPQVQLSYIANLSRHRCSNRFVTDAHYAANMLHHRYRGKQLQPGQKLQAISYIESLAEDLGLNLQQLGCEFEMFNKNLGPFALVTVKSASHPAIFWERIAEFGACSVITQIGRALAAIGPSSSIVERSFSAAGRIHTKDRSRMSAETARKCLDVEWFFKCGGDSVHKSIDAVEDEELEDLIIDEALSEQELLNTDFEED